MWQESNCSRMQLISFPHFGGNAVFLYKSSSLCNFLICSRRHMCLSCAVLACLATLLSLYLSLCLRRELQVYFQGQQVDEGKVEDRRRRRRRRYTREMGRN